MVGVVNPNSTQTLAAQIEAAKSANYDVAPGEPVPGEATGTGATSTPTSSSEASGPSDGQMIGTIVGVCVGIAAFVALVGALCFFVWRSKSWKKIVQKHDKREEQSAMMKPVDVGGLEMGHVQLAPHAPQSPYSPPLRQSDFGSPLPPYASPHPHPAHLDMEDRVGGKTGQQWSK
jgi:hypothetical protein